jgi:hypothetical protein
VRGRPGIHHRRPFAETKEQLGGFILIEARDLNEAIQVAAKIRWPVAAASRFDRSRSSGLEEGTMKFMFMIYHDETVLDGLPKDEMQALVDSALDYDDEIRRSGHYIVSDALQPARTARTIRVRGGKVSTTGRPLCRDEGAARRFFPDRGP